MTRRTAAFAIASALGTELRAANVPRPAPDFSVRLPGGRVAKVSDFKGKVLVLGFILTT